MNNEQLELMLHFDNQINVIGKLKRKIEPIITKVKLDEFIKKASENFDYDFDGSNKFYPFEFNDILKELDFNILVITGASGSGKSTFSKYFGKEEELDWDNTKSIMSAFNTPDEAVERLMSVGLNSIPTWCKPRNVLSVGEGFRADLARRIKDNCVVDEFTSTVDRNVALSCSASVSKYIRRKNIKKCVFVSCHKDFIDTLCPDYVIDLDDEVIYDTRGLLRRKFELSIYEKTNKREIWNIFGKHHYLSADLNVAGKMFVAYLNNELVAMCSILPQPGVADGNAWRVHRLVCLPDYQGLSISTNLLNKLSDMFMYHNKIVYIRTSHTKLINYLLKHKDWYGDGKLKYSVEEAGLLKSRKVLTSRKSASFKYVSSCKNNENLLYENIKFIENKKENEFEQENIFNIIDDIIEQPKKELKQNNKIVEIKEKTINVKKQINKIDNEKLNKSINKKNKFLEDKKFVEIIQTELSEKDFNKIDELKNKNFKLVNINFERMYVDTYLIALFEQQNQKLYLIKFPKSYLLTTEHNYKQYIFRKENEYAK